MFYRAQQLNPNCPHCFFHISWSLIERKEYPRAIYCLKRVLELDPEYDRARALMARAYRGMGEIEKAQAHCLEALREDPGDVDLICELGEMLAENGEMQRAVGKFRQAVDLAPERTDARFALAQSLLLADEPEEAVTEFEWVAQRDPDIMGLALQYGSALLRLGRLKDARRKLQQAVEDDPTSVNALMLLGNCLLRLQKPEAATERFRGVLAADASQPAAHHNLGVCCFLLGRHEEGIEHCRRAIELRPDYRMAILKTALAYQKIGRFAESQSMLAHGMKVDPENELFRQMARRMWRVRIGYWVNRIKGAIRRLISPGRSEAKQETALPSRNGPG